MKSKITVFAVATLFSLVAVLGAGCKSSAFVNPSQVGYTPVDLAKCEILGTVTFVGQKNKGANYAQLLAFAKETYPNVDEVVNIHVDSDGSGIGPISFGKTITVTGIAVRYKK